MTGQCEACDSAESVKTGTVYTCSACGRGFARKRGAPRWQDRLYTCAVCKCQFVPGGRMCYYRTPQLCDSLECRREFGRVNRLEALQNG